MVDTITTKIAVNRLYYNVSFHVNTDSSTLIGTDTFTGGEVRLRDGPIAQAARYGGFCILDEINMANLGASRPSSAAGRQSSRANPPDGWKFHH